MLEKVVSVSIFVLILQRNAPHQSCVDAWRPFVLHHSNVSAVSFSDQIFINASIDDQGRLSVYFQSSVNIYPYLNVHVTMDSGNGLYDLEYVNRTLDICRLFRDSKYEPFLQLLMRVTLSATNNFQKRCPIGKKLFYVKNLILNPEQFPPVLPEKKIYYAVRLLSKNGSALKPIVAYQIYIEIKNK